MSSPSLLNFKIVQLVTMIQKIDFGSIAKAFGLDPSALKLNGYFISRGIDLISSSMTAVLVASKVVNNDIRDKVDELPESISQSQFACSYTNIDKFDGLFTDIRDKVDELPGSISQSQFACSYTNKNLKRIRDDEILVANYKIHF
ncbi:hypothetical protein RYX36_022118 [Vicia faba]